MRRSLSSRIGLCLGACALALVVMATPAAPAPASPAAKVNARLTKTSFTSSQAKSVKLIYSFATPSKTFAYKLTFKKGKKWQSVRTVTRKGAFKGSKSMTVRAIFGGKSIRAGSYRLALRYDYASKLLAFKVLKSGKIVGPVGGGSSGGTTPPPGPNPPPQNPPPGTAVNLSLSVHSNHSCALLANGTVKCWGANWNGQLGDGSLIHQSTPTPVVGISGAIGVDAGDAHTCALLGDGTAKCWGFNDSGQLGDGSTAGSGVPVTVSGLTGAKQITAGSSHTCALLQNGTVVCWGSDASGQLGNGAAGSSLTPSPVSGLSNVAEVSAGDFHTCARLNSGAVWCWGSGAFGRLGNNSTSDSPVPVQVAGVGGSGWLSGATDVSAGGAHSCAVLGSGSVVCWGFNERGELGNGDPTYSSSSFPVAVQGISTGSGVSTGEAHSCAVLSGGTVECWGFNHYGQIGSAVQPGSNIPIAVGGVATATQVSAGGSHTCALLSDGSGKCWGYNAFGQLGNGRALDSPTAVSSSGIAAAPLEVGGGNFHTCALLAGGTVECWGWNGRGELGNNTFDDSSSPVAVSGLSGVTDIGVGGSVGGGHTCAVVTGGTVWCWGYNSHGQLGDGGTGNSPVPVQVSGITTALQVSSGGEHSCAVLDNALAADPSDNTVVCWGYNLRGQLGNNSTTDSPTPVTVVGVGGTGNLTGVAAVSAGGSHTCALLSGGTVDCWGDNGFGKLGNGSTTDSLTPVAVSGLSGVAEVSTGFQHSCARTAGGAVSCWGYNGYGELGVSSPTDPFSTTPVAAPVSGATDVVTGDYHTCAVTAGGAVQCWGDNSHGQLGNGGFGGGFSPVTVTGVTASSGATALGAGRAHSCAITSSGLSCWGWNGDGQLGNSVVTHTPTPQNVTLG